MRISGTWLYFPSCWVKKSELILIFKNYFFRQIFIKISFSDPDPFHFGLPDPGSKNSAKIMEIFKKKKLPKSQKIIFFFF